ncbi:MAG: hypothetical protein KF730_15385 [Sphingomonas sp.]|uniref:hypothetical protein n=1 Tax=Sphingomonas sp. TaxID=28214 RepID=UPI0025D3DB45|nr:hypothetical protein [Sphingomonas sp.]MBX3565947.1 hypothetical protein [Sphingomonas sp.]
MRKTILSLAAFAVAVPVGVSLPTDSAQAQSRSSRYYAGTNYSKARYIKKCRRSPGTAGLIAGGVAGAVAGPAIVGGGLLGTVVGGVGGALGGRAIDRTITAKQRCYYIRRR